MSTLTPAQYERIKDRLTEEERAAVERALGMRPGYKYFTPPQERMRVAKVSEMAAAAEPKPEPKPVPPVELPTEPGESLAEPAPLESPAEPEPSIGTMVVDRPLAPVPLGAMTSRTGTAFPSLKLAEKNLKEQSGGGAEKFDVSLTEAQKFVAEYGDRVVRDVAERKIAAAKEQFGRDLNEQEIQAIRGDAAKDVEDMLFTRTSALQQDWREGKLGEVVTVPGETAGEFKYNAPAIVQRYENALIDRGIKDLEKSGSPLTPEARRKIEADARDQAKRDVFSIVGWSPTRQNAFIPLDPVDTQIEKIREAEAPGLLGMSPSYLGAQTFAKAAYEQAYGRGTYRDSAHAKALTPFIAAMTPGFTQSDMVDYEGKPIGPATRESWLFSATRSPFTAPFAAYYFGDDVKEWNDDAHLKALAMGVDLTTAGAQLGMKIGEYTPVNIGETGQAMAGTMAIMPILMLDPDLPSLVTGGASEALKGFSGVRKAVALANAKKADAMADLLEESGEAVGDAIMIDPKVDAYSAATSKYSRPGSGGIESNESLMVKEAEARAKLRVGAELGAGIAPSLADASKHAKVLEEAERNMGVAFGEQLAAKERFRESMTEGESLARDTTAGAATDLIGASAAGYQADSDMQKAVRNQIGAQEVADRSAADRTRLASQQAMERPQAKLDEAVRRYEGAPASFPGPVEDVKPVDLTAIKEQDAIRKVVKEVRAQATDAAKEAKTKLDELRKVMQWSANPKRLEEIIENSRVHKAKMDEVREAIEQLEAVPKKDLDPKTAEQLRQLRLAKLSLERQAIVDISDGGIVSAYESWKTARAAHASVIAKAAELEAKLGDPKAAAAARAAAREGETAAARAAARNARLMEMRDKEVAAATDRVMKANDALVKARKSAMGITVGPEPGAAKALEKANKNVEAAELALKNAKANLASTQQKFRDVSDAPLKFADQKLLKAVFKENQDAIADLVAKSKKAKQAEQDLRGAMRYKEILREEYRNLAKSYRELAALPADAPVTAGAARAKTSLDTVAMRGNDSMLPWGNKTFTYNFDSELGLRANLMNAINLMKLRADSRFDRFLDRVASRGFGPMEKPLRDISARAFGRFRGAVTERNEVAKQAAAARKAKQARARGLVEELKTAAPQRAEEIRKELGRLELEVIQDDYDFITSATPIFYGKHKDATVTNTIDGLSHADRALQYLKIIHSGGNEANDLVTTGLARVWMPSGAGALEAGEMEPAARAWLAEVVKESRTGAEFLERLRSPGERPFAMWAADTGAVEGRMRAWDFTVRSLIAGSTMRDALWDVMRAAGPNLTSSEAAAFNVLAAMPSKSLTADALKTMADKGIADLKKLDEVLAKYGTGYTQQAVTQWRPTGKGEAASLRLLKLGVTEVGDEVILPEHVFRAMQDIPDRFAKQVTQWDVEQNPGVAAFNAYLASKRLNMVYGTWIPRLRQYAVQPIGDWSQAAVDISVGAATRATVSAAAWLLPGIAHDVARYLGPTGRSLLGSIADGDFGRIMKGDRSLIIETAEGPIDGLTFLTQLVEDRTWTSMGSDALNEMRAKNLFSDMSKKPVYKKLFETMYEPNRFVEKMADDLEELQKRQRMRLVYELRPGRATGVKVARDAAQKAMLDSQFDWMLGTWPWENEGIFKLLLFHNYRKNAVLRRVGMLTEAMTTPGHDYFIKAMTGQTKLGRTISFAQVNATDMNAIAYEDKNTIVSDLEAFLAWGEKEFPHFADSLSIVSREAMSTAEREWDTRVRGKAGATHSMWSTAPLSFMDDLHSMHIIGVTAATTAVWAYEEAGGRGDVTHAQLSQVYGEASKLITDMFNPAIRKYAQAIADAALRRESRPQKDVPISRDTALAMDRLGIRFPLVEQRDDGKYVLDGVFAELTANLAAEILPAYQDMLRTVAITNNPSFNENIVRGGVESMAKLFGIFSRTTYDPASATKYEEQRKASELKEMIKEADPFDKK